jgi:hypothetical protein
MNLTIDLTGAARALCGVHSVEFLMEDHPTYYDVIERLGKTFPDLIGVVIDQDGRSLLSSVLLYVNDSQWIMPGMWGQMPMEGDRLTLLGVITGG